MTVVDCLLAARQSLHALQRDQVRIVVEAELGLAILTHDVGLIDAPGSLQAFGKQVSTAVFAGHFGQQQGQGQL